MLYEFQETGDIIFTFSSAKAGDWIAAAQELADGGLPALATHALLCLVPGLYIQSLKKNGVEICRADNYKISINKTDAPDSQFVAAFRLKGSKLAHDVIIESAFEHWGQIYNLDFGRKLSDQHHQMASFCSELISKIYRKFGHAIVPGRDETAFPSRLMRALQVAEDWRDVTQEYTVGFKTGSDMSEELTKSRLLLQNGRIDSVLFLAKMRREMVNIDNELSRMTAALLERHKSIAAGAMHEVPGEAASKLDHNEIEAPNANSYSDWTDQYCKEVRAAMARRSPTKRGYGHSPTTRAQSAESICYDVRANVASVKSASGSLAYLGDMESIISNIDRMSPGNRDLEVHLSKVASRILNLVNRNLEILLDDRFHIPVDEGRIERFRREHEEMTREMWEDEPFRICIDAIREWVEARSELNGIVNSILVLRDRLAAYENTTSGDTIAAGE